jgi:hypothetical protein
VHVLPPAGLQPFRDDCRHIRACGAVPENRRRLGRFKREIDLHRMSLGRADSRAVLGQRKALLVARVNNGQQGLAIDCLPRRPALGDQLAHARPPARIEREADGIRLVAQDIAQPFRGALHARFSFRATGRSALRVVDRWFIP